MLRLAPRAPPTAAAADRRAALAEIVHHAELLASPVVRMVAYALE